MTFIVFLLKYFGMYDFSDSHYKYDDDDIIMVPTSVWRAEHRTWRNVMLLHPKTNSLSIKMHRKTERP